MKTQDSTYTMIESLFSFIYKQRKELIYLVSLWETHPYMEIVACVANSKYSPKPHVLDDMENPVS